MVNQQQNKDSQEQNTISFLDVIACAFGAIVLLVLILPIGERATEDVPNQSIEQSGRLLFLIDSVREEIALLQSQVATNETLLESVQSESSSIADATAQISEAVQRTNDQLANVEAENKAVATTRTIVADYLAQQKEAASVPTELGGIPVDSEYLVFVVDTSGSMQMIWDDVIDEVERFWLLYPELKGFQVMNDNGAYLYGHTRGRWIPDSDSRRKRALARMGYWPAYSDSSPVDGIAEAIDDLYRAGDKMAIVVVGDDYQGQSFEGFLDDVDKKVTSRSVGEADLRIHALGFWNSSGVSSPENLSVLMRELTRRYNGAFVALESQ